MLIKFTGDFKKLIPMGFTFYKLFARNYKVYEKNGIWVWVANGGYVELEDFYSLSGYVVGAILDETYPVYEKDSMFRNITLYKKGDLQHCMINRKTGELITRKDFVKEHGFFEYDYKLFREVYVNEKSVNVIKEIKDMIEIVPEAS